MCEVAVCKGDDGGHAGARSRMSECHDVVYEHRGTWELERESATEMATFEGQRTGSGRSCIGNRAGFAQQRGSSRAVHEAATCSPARVKPGP